MRRPSVAKLAETVSSSPGGSVYALAFTLPKTGNGNTFSLNARITPQGKVFSLSRKSTDPVVPWEKVDDAEGLFDLKRNEVRIWADVSSFVPHAKLAKGVPVAGLRATAGRVYAALIREDDTDSATSNKAYKAGTASCLSIGR